MNATLHFECSSCASEMAGIRARMRESTAGFGFDEDTIGHLVLTIDEACTNIHRYAYEGRSDVRIEVDVITEGDVWEVRLRDYGKKCDPAQLKGRELEDVRPGGLGLFFIRQAFDEVHFDHSPEEGTCLILRKRKKSPAA